MEPNPHHAEIRATRDRIAKECDYDVRKLGERIRRREAEEKARGATFVSFATPESRFVREETPASET